MYNMSADSEDHRGLIAIFKKEAELLRSLKHPNVVQYMGAVYERGKLRYMMTEYANGGSLEGWLKKQVPAPVCQLPLDRISMCRR